MLLVLFKFHESQQKQHGVCRWRHLYLLQFYFLFLTDIFTFSSWYLVPKIKPNFDPQFQNSTWNSQSRKYFFCSDLKGKDVVGMKKMLYKECAAWIACRQLLPAIALAAALAWLSAASNCQLNSSFVSAIGHIGFYHKGIKNSDELAPAAFFESTLFRFDEIFFQDWDRCIIFLMKSKCINWSTSFFVKLLQK